jgi:hypothetical protein
MIQAAALGWFEAWAAIRAPIRDPMLKLKQLSAVYQPQGLAYITGRVPFALGLPHADIGKNIAMARQFKKRLITSCRPSA